MELMQRRRELLMQNQRGEKMLIPADDPANPNANYYGSNGYVFYDLAEQAFEKSSTGSVVYTAHTLRDGVNSRMFVAPRSMIVRLSFDYKNVNTTYGLRVYVNTTRIRDVHDVPDSIWKSYAETFELQAGDTIHMLIYKEIYWRNLKLVEE